MKEYELYTAVYIETYRYRMCVNDEYVLTVSLEEDEVEEFEDGGNDDQLLMLMDEALSGGAQLDTLVSVNDEHFDITYEPYDWEEIS